MDSLFQIWHQDGIQGQFYISNVIIPPCGHPCAHTDIAEVVVNAGLFAILVLSLAYLSAVFLRQPKFTHEKMETNSTDVLLDILQQDSRTQPRL